MDQLEHQDRAAPMSAQNLIFLPTPFLPKFVGRNEVLSAIDKSWKTSSTASATQLSTIILGIGGQGKTQLALEYCRRSLQAKLIEAVFWLDASSPESMGWSYQVIAAQAVSTTGHALDDRSAAAVAIAFISDLPVRWMVVLDNFDNPGLFPTGIRSHLPSSPNGLGRWLFTSRHQDASALGTAIILHRLTEDEGLELFVHHLGIGAETYFSRDKAISIINRFDQLPLAIQKCAAYIRHNMLSLETFDQLYEWREAFPSNLWVSVPQVGDDGRQAGEAAESDHQTLLSLNTILQLSLAQVGGLKTQLPQGVATMLSFLSLFDRKDVSEEMAMAVRDDSGSIPPWMLGCYTDGKWDTRKFKDILSDLHSLGLLETSALSSEDSSFSLHPIIQEWLRLRIPPSQREALAKMALTTMDTIVATRLASLDVVDFRAKPWLLAHVDAVRASTQWVTFTTSNAPLASTQRAKHFAAFYSYTRCERIDTAASLYQDLLSPYQGTDPLSLDPLSLASDTLDLFHDAATILVEQSRYADAEDLFREALKGETALLGADHESTLLTARKLGMATE